jgi:hypothetical protein
VTTANQLADGAVDAIDKARPALEVWGRAGYVVRGLLYILLGGLSILAAWNGAHTVGTGGLLQKIHYQPFGRVMLFIIAAGFTGSGLWQVMQAVEGPLRGFARKKIKTSRDQMSWGRRAAYFGRGISHWVIALAALHLLLYPNPSDPSGNEQARGWTAWLMSYPFGQWLVGLVGAGIAARGLVQFGGAIIGKLQRDRDSLPDSPAARRWLMAITRFGKASRGVVFVMLGLFLMLAAWHHNPHVAQGVGGALDVLQRQGYGPWLLGIVAFGLMAYGVYQLLMARYRR